MEDGGPSGSAEIGTTDSWTPLFCFCSLVLDKVWRIDGDSGASALPCALLSIFLASRGVSDLLSFHLHAWRERNIRNTSEGNTVDFSFVLFQSVASIHSFFFHDVVFVRRCAASCSAVTCYGMLRVTCSAPLHTVALLSSPSRCTEAWRITLILQRRCQQWRLQDTGLSGLIWLYDNTIVCHRVVWGPMARRGISDIIASCPALTGL